ncbi:aminomethyl-transferring glycine dehydrogenase subunit GcvPA [Blautia sp. OF03-15BH]|uniref:aminomethyl-transferring glycine dehydrogenase subunit GcvPA n=1 Tax=Blautia sp. OF03-15BH TaxID=2292287 RepID=UPI000E51A09C|nr:aminomethyl-transferring glycine dehydrogenase subunit GcvPA [Blautia sp. OF03-15BH]RGY01894.1 aminomethyl-transferring glycine dehydrogenase subunit GcvPA [Blautia sp. OF03-15BH]
MGSYIPSTREERLAMLESIGMHSFDELYADIPEALRLKDGLSLPSGLSELEVAQKIEEIAGKNTRFSHIFRGAGSYQHYIPAIVKQVTSKEEFVTAYTPYQAEISQGLLQSIFEYQTMICELTGMDVSNASVYDGATAAAEAAAMCRDRKRGTICVSASVDPKTISVIRTYCFGSGAPLVILPEKNGLTDMESWNAMDTSSIACLIIQTPNYHGLIEDGASIANAVHNSGAKLIASCNPIALGLLETPGEFGADVAVGEGQPLGLPMGFGGPYLGFMASTKDMMRKLPGRIVGQTADVDGKRAYVLTLQAREQHIRREKASSNICSNEALCAMTAAVYLSAMGSAGLEKVAASCMANARYLLEELTALGFTRKYTGEFFHEFVTICPCDAAVLSEKLAAHGYLSGLVTGQTEMLWCTTEMNTKSEIDGLIAVIKEVLA